ncbi:MAG: hypothetical protein HOQ01_09510 [Lysobacter sp.]|nr:hypothetical protein [Lysobacter sp.]
MRALVSLAVLAVLAPCDAGAQVAARDVPQAIETSGTDDLTARLCRMTWDAEQRDFAEVRSLFDRPPRGFLFLQTYGVNNLGAWLIGEIRGRPTVAVFEYGQLRTHTIPKATLARWNETLDSSTPALWDTPIHPACVFVVTGEGTYVPESFDEARETREIFDAIQAMGPQEGNG